MTDTLRLRAATGTHPGQVYKLNQDKVFASIRAPGRGRTTGLFIVADGMGGHQAGEIASEIAVGTMEEELSWIVEPGNSEDTKPTYPRGAGSAEGDEAEEHPLQRRLHFAIQQANRAITGYSRENPEEAGNLGTTLTCVLVDDDTAVVANVGDSRTYLLRDNDLRQITEDHSYVAQLVRQGQIRPEEVYTHPRRNVITRSLGYQESVDVDFWLERLEPGDRLLLCSDGLWEMVQDDAILAGMLAAEETPRQTVEQLIYAANKNGGADNIGVVVVHVDAD